MLGVFLQSIASLFQEISCSVGKREVNAGRESIFMMGFFQHLAGVSLFGLLLLLGFEKFVFNPASLWLFGPRVILEILQLHITLLAIDRVDRSTFGFVKVGTVPLLLLVDLLIGYQVLPFQIVGMVLLIGVFLYMFIGKVIDKKGMGLLLFSTINPVLTISMYKYNIVHYNSIGAEQGIIYLILLIYLFGIIRWKTKEKLGKYFRRPVSLVQALADAFGSIIASYAFLFAPASVITAATRSAGVLWSTLSGIVIFKEGNRRNKLFVAFLLMVVLVLLAGG